jgi:hypothetical protein
MSETNNEQVQPATLEDYIAQHQQSWSSVITEMNLMMKKFSDLPELQMTIYSKRQNALDYYFNLLHQVSSMSREYKKQYAAKYNSYKVNSQIRYNSDAAINAQIAADLADITYKLTLLENHAKYMQETIKTIDNLIYAISNRIRIEELIQNVK